METIYRVIQWIWGFPQTLLGFIKYLQLKDYPHDHYNGAIITKWPRKGGMSLGMYLFISNDEFKHHEYGHSIQSLILGPLYLLIIGLPSYVWCNLPYFRKKRIQKNLSYTSLYCETWAENIGNKIRQKEMR